jgi:hypothetical protein
MSSKRSSSRAFDVCVCCGLHAINLRNSVKPEERQQLLARLQALIGAGKVMEPRKPVFDEAYILQQPVSAGHAPVYCEKSLSFCKACLAAGQVCITAHDPSKGGESCAVSSSI